MPSISTIWRTKRPYFELIGLFSFLLLVILYGVKGWKHYFFIGLADHWDPKIMGEWMAWNARNILHGHFLVPDYNANFFYPHSYTLAFSELLWPESFFYAFFYVVSSNPFFSFNATMLFFWALSGILLFILLRTLDITPLISALGSLIYCLMPFRMPYYVEFNMVLVFIFPLMILLLMRWLKDPSWKNALWFCLGYFISATSCLYYTIMAIIIMLFCFLAYLKNNKSLLQNRRFYLSAILITCGVSIISAIYLYPYALLRIQGGYQRSTADYMKYFAQPIQYLDTGSAALLRWIRIPQHHFAETILFPGTVLSFLVLVFLIYSSVQFIKKYSLLSRAARLIGVGKLILWIIFWSITLIQTYQGPVAWLKPIDPLLYYVAFSLIFLYILGIFFKEETNHSSRIILTGMAVAAVVCFFVSLGPYISVGPDKHRLLLARGPFQNLASWNPLFSAVRGLTRFSIVILTYLTVAGCYVLNLLVQKHKKILWVIPLLAAILIYEARVMIVYRFEDCRPFITSHVIQKAQDLPGKNVLFMLPIAIRNAEGDIVMTSIGKFPLLIDGWSGFSPHYYDQLFYWEDKKWDLAKIFHWVKEVWPPAILIVDKTRVKIYETGWRKPFPWRELNQDWEPVDNDKRFILYKQKQLIYTSHHIIRRVRTDVLKMHPLLCFKAHSTLPATVSIVLDNKIVRDKIPLTKDWKEYSVALPKSDMGNIKGEEIDLNLTSHPASHQSWEVKDIDFLASR